MAHDRVRAQGPLAWWLPSLAVALLLPALGCAPATGPWKLAPEDVERTLALRKAAMDDPDEGGLAGAEAGWIALLHTNDLTEAGALFDRSLQMEPTPLALLGAAMAAQGRGDADAATDAWLALLRQGDERLLRLAAARLAELPEQAPGIAERVGRATRRAIPRGARGSALLDLDDLDRAMTQRIEGAVPGAPRGAITEATVTGPLPARLASGFGMSVEDLGKLDAEDRRVVAPGGSLIVHPLEEGVFLVRMAALPTSGPSTVRLDTKANVRLYALSPAGEARLLIERDSFERPQPRLIDASAELAPGSVLLAVVAADRPGVTLTVRVVPASDAGPGAPLPAPVDALVRAQLAERAGDVDAAYAAVEILALDAPRCALAAALEARVRTADSSLPRDVAAALARSLLERALADCPDCVDVRAGLERLLRDAGAEDQARTLLTEGRGQQPGTLRWEIRLAELDHQAGWDTEAELALRDVLRRHPGSCLARSALFELLWDRPRTVASLLEVPPGSGACSRTAELPLRAALRRGDGEAAEALAREALDRSPDDEIAFQSLVKAMLVAERPAEARALLRERAARYPREASYVFQEAEAAALAGDTATAREAWRRLAASGGGDADLRHRLALLGFGELWSRFTVDGRTLARDFRTLPGESDAAAVWLLDDAITVYYPDGGSAQRTHVVIKLLTEGAASEAGEVSLPAGAEVLHVRTLKASGELLEPEDIIEKDTLSLPNLEVGDFIEVVLVRFEDADARFAPGHPGDSFFFGSFDGPVRRARFLAIAPAGTELLTETLGDAVRALTPVELPGFRVLGWEATHQPQAAREPLALDPQAALPQVRVALDTSWQDLRAAWGEQVARRVQGGRALDRFVARAGASSGSLDERARALFAAAQQEVVLDDSGGFLLDPASHVLARGRGERVMLLRAALSAAGVPARIVLVNPLDRSSPHEPTVPDLRRYSYPVIAVETGSSTVWLDASLDLSPYDYLAPTLQERPALDIESDGTLTRMTPRWPMERERHLVRQDLVLGDDGALTGHSVESIDGIAAVSYRRYLVAADPERQRELLQAVVSSAFPGATVTNLELRHLRDPSRRLELRYDVRVPAGAPEQRGAEELVFAVAPEGLSRRFVAIGERTTPFLLNGHFDVDAQVRIVLPGGVSSPRLPEPVLIDNELARYDLSFDQSEDDGRVVVTTRKRWKMPMRIVRPEDYDLFKTTASRIDRADRVRLELTRLKVSQAGI